MNDATVGEVQTLDVDKLETEIILVKIKGRMYSNDRLIMQVFIIPNTNVA
jgi:hypothetical protein